MLSIYSVSIGKMDDMAAAPSTSEYHGNPDISIAACRNSSVAGCDRKKAGGVSVQTQA